MSLNAKVGPSEVSNNIRFSSLVNGKGGDSLALSTRREAQLIEWEYCQKRPMRKFMDKETSIEILEGISCHALQHSWLYACCEEAHNSCTYIWKGDQIIFPRHQGINRNIWQLKRHKEAAIISVCR